MVFLFEAGQLEILNGGITPLTSIKIAWTGKQYTAESKIPEDRFLCFCSDNTHISHSNIHVIHARKYHSASLLSYFSGNTTPGPRSLIVFLCASWFSIIDLSSTPNTGQVQSEIILSLIQEKLARKLCQHY